MMLGHSALLLSSFLDVRGTLEKLLQPGGQRNLPFSLTSLAERILAWIRRKGGRATSTKICKRSKTESLSQAKRQVSRRL